MANAQHYFFIIFEVFDKATTSLKIIEKRMASLSKTSEVMNKRMQTFDMRFLSMMFSGMAMQRAVMGAGRSLFNTFDKVEGKTSEFGKATGHLGASWEFLKFTIVSALEHPSMIAFIFKIVDMIKATAQWAKENEGIVRVLIGIGIVLGIIGTLFLIVGQFGLAWGSIFSSGGLLPQWIGSFFTWFKGIFLWIGNVMFPWLGKQVASVFTWLLANPIALFAVVILGTLLLLSDKFGGFGEVVKSVFRGIFRFVIIIADGLVAIFSYAWSLIIGNIIKSVDAINNIIMRINDAFGTSFGRISTSGLTSAMSDYTAGDLMSKYTNWEEENLAPKLGWTDKDPLDFYFGGGGLFEAYNMQTDLNEQIGTQMTDQTESLEQQNELLREQVTLKERMVELDEQKDLLREVGEQYNISVIN